MAKEDNLESGWILPRNGSERQPKGRPLLKRMTVFVILPVIWFYFAHSFADPVPTHAEDILAKCKSLNKPAGPPPDFSERGQSDRFEPGTKPTLIKNAKIWTGSENGTEVFVGDILLDHGLIRGVGHYGDALLESYGARLDVIDAKGAWVTPGIVDIHSHLGDSSSPELQGAIDDNSNKGTAQPWLRSLDGLNTHDDAYPLSIAGGVTTSLILPGSANAIGGQAFPIKLRKTSERSPTSMLLEPPFQLNGTSTNYDVPPRWRHMKHACGENPSGVYGDTRMDTLWAFRNAYNTAFQLKKKQDEYCEKAEAGQWIGLGDFPESLQWEALVDVLRGHVKVNIHCYEPVDLDDLVRLTNEFQFEIAAFHHAHEAYLVPDVLKRAYGKTPGAAIFATNARYKREAYRGSEFASRILTEAGITVMMKSDHPVLNSRYLLYEAQQAYYFGLPENVALRSVTSNSAEMLGMGHRIGYIKEGWDADLVLWDSHPLALGATPTQVFIDGIAQLSSPYVVHKGKPFQKLPAVPNFDKEAQAAVEYEGLPPLNPTKASSTVIFSNVTSLYSGAEGTIQNIFTTADSDIPMHVLVRDGRILCHGMIAQCLTDFSLTSDDATMVDLAGGSIVPGLISFGAPLGLDHIDQEPSTDDGIVYDPFGESVPSILGGDSALPRAADGLQFTTRDALLAYRSGVTHGITAPKHHGFLSGLGVMFSTGAQHKLEKNAVPQAITAIHVAVRPLGVPSVSSQIATLRKLLLRPGEGEAGEYFKKAANGEITLVVEAHSADIIATLVVLKKEVEDSTGYPLRLTISGAAEAHLLAKELGEANVGVIVSPPRPFPYKWEDRRILPGPPLTEHSVISKLVTNNVTVGIGIEEIWSARHARLDLAWATLEADGKLSREHALALGSVNLEKLLGVKPREHDFVATSGGDILDFGSKVAAVISPIRGFVDLM